MYFIVPLILTIGRARRMPKGLGSNCGFSVGDIALKKTDYIQKAAGRKYSTQKHMF